MMTALQPLQEVSEARFHVETLSLKNRFSLSKTFLVALAALLGAHLEGGPRFLQRETQSGRAPVPGLRPRVNFALKHERRLALLQQELAKVSWRPTPPLTGLHLCQHRHRHKVEL